MKLIDRHPRAESTIIALLGQRLKEWPSLLRLDYSGARLVGCFICGLGPLRRAKGLALPDRPSVLTTQVRCPRCCGHAATSIRWLISTLGWRRLSLVRLDHRGARGWREWPQTGLCARAQQSCCNGITDHQL